MGGRNLVAGAMALLAAQAASAQGTPPPLAPHRAVYDLELREAEERAGIEAIYGRMVFEFTGAACKGYTTRFRFATRIDTGEEARTSDQRLTSFEDERTGMFRFDNQSFTDEKPDKQVKGEAITKEDGTVVSLEGEEARTIDLPKSVFPTAHMREVIAQAMAGTPLFDARIFDGSENGDKSLLVTTIIGKPEQGGGGDAEVAKALADKSWWPVTASYFNDGPDGDSEPTYRLSFKLYDNGISRDLVMDYGDFSMAGKLSSLELLPEESCEAPKTP